MPADDLPPQDKSQKPGRFKPGRSGNPGGPKPGQRHPAFAALDAIGHEGAESVLRSVVAAAEGGDMRAAEILLRRAWPERKGRPVAFVLPASVGAAGLVEAMGAVTEAMASGGMTPDEASAVAGVLEIHRKAIATEDHEQRLRALEEGKA